MSEHRMGAAADEIDRPRRRESDRIVGQIRSLWPVLAFCCVGYAAWAVQRAKLEDTSSLAVKTAEDVGVLKQTVAVQTAMLTDIRDAVKEIARRRRNE